MKLRIGCAVVGFLSLVVSLAAQTSGNVPAQVPPLIQFSNVATDEGGNTLSGVVSVTFSLYSSQQGGQSLWTEKQNNIQLDPTGHYSVQLGVTKPAGMPTALFTSGEARWLGVRIAEQAEPPRVLLLSVPYALKAGDAATVGGLPPSAFVLAGPQNGAASGFATQTATGQGAPPPSGNVTGTGTVNYLPLWDSASDIVSSVLFQSGKGAKAKVGIGTTKPASTLDVKGGGTIRGLFSLPPTGTATASAGFNSQPMDLAGSVFNSGTSTAVTQTFQWQAEPVGNDTNNATGSLNLLFAQGTGKPAETGLNIASNGQITFATGQSFPGTGDGTITGVTAGTDLTGGGSSGSVTLNLDTAKVPQLSGGNSFTGNQSVNGNVSATQLNSTAAQGTAPLQVTSTTQVPNLNASLLDGFSASAFQPAGSYATTGSNTFTGDQNITGKVAATGAISGAAGNSPGW